MSPAAALSLVSGITSESPAERDSWSGVAGFEWSSDGTLDDTERSLLASVHVYVALLEVDRPDIREKLLDSIVSLNIAEEMPTPLLELLLIGIPRHTLNASAVDYYDDLTTTLQSRTARATQDLLEAGGTRIAVGPQRCVHLIRGLCTSPSPMGWCRILDGWVEAGELDAYEIIAAAAVVGWAAVVQYDDATVRAARLATLLNLGRRGLLPAAVRDQVTTCISAYDLDDTGAGLLRSITALPPGPAGP
jgi:hypothetical protein